MSDDATMALWWVRYASPDFDLFSDEDEAALAAWGIEDSGGAAVLGVQFADGRIIGRDEWPALAKAYRRIEDKARRRAEAPATPPRPTRKVLDPFGGRPVEVDPGTPSWLGRQ